MAGLSRGGHHDIGRRHQVGDAVGIAVGDDLALGRLAGLMAEPCRQGGVRAGHGRHPVPFVGQLVGHFCVHAQSPTARHEQDQRPILVEFESGPRRPPFGNREELRTNRRDDFNHIGGRLVLAYGGGRHGRADQIALDAGMHPDPVRRGIGAQDCGAHPGGALADPSRATGAGGENTEHQVGVAGGLEESPGDPLG